MKGLKGMLGICIGLIGVLVFCGTASWCVPYGVEWVYSLRGGEFLPPAVIMSALWLIGYVALVCFFVIAFVGGLTRGRTVAFFALGACHWLGAFSLFYMHNLTISLLLNLAISFIYIWLFLGVQRVYPRFFALNLVYFLWICYIIALNYCLLIFN